MPPLLDFRRKTFGGETSRHAANSVATGRFRSPYGNADLLANRTNNQRKRIREEDNMAGPQIPKDFRRVIIAAAVGNVIEWYDFYIFGSFAAVLSVKFFEKS